MTPTMELRFVERNTPVTLNGERFDNWQKVLQQFWEASFYEQSIGIESEWRDVPVQPENLNV